MVVLGRLSREFGAEATEIDVMAANLALSQPCRRSRDRNEGQRPYAGDL